MPYKQEKRVSGRHIIFFPHPLLSSEAMWYWLLVGITIVLHSGNGIYLKWTRDGLLPAALQMIYSKSRMLFESETTDELKMRVHRIFLLVVLGCSWAGGRIVPKCELRDQLIWATSSLPQKAKDSGLDSEKFMTKSKWQRCTEVCLEMK